MLLTIKEAIEKIQQHQIIFFAGEENLLKELPQGNWIGGTIPYFMTEKGGMETSDKLFATIITDNITINSVKWYNNKTIENITIDSPENGFSFIIIPSSSEVHMTYAKNAPEYPELFLKPIIGWIAGINLNNLGKNSAKVFNGMDNTNASDKAVVMHLNIPSNKIAKISIVNLFKQGNGDVISFLEEGFKVKDCFINGEKNNFCDYLLARDANIKLPLVANYSGTLVNVSIQTIDIKEKTVTFYAPVFQNIEYRIASPLYDYVSDFQKALPQSGINPLFSCNCILNYLYSELEGKKTGNLYGPITFGEIAYQLLNQTLTYVELVDK